MFNWAGRTRTFKCRSQNPVPCHLATAHHLVDKCYYSMYPKNCNPFFLIFLIFFTIPKICITTSHASRGKQGATQVYLQSPLFFPGHTATAAAGLCVSIIPLAWLILLCGVSEKCCSASSLAEQHFSDTTYGRRPQRRVALATLRWRG